MADLRARAAPQPVAQHDERPREGEQQRQEEVEEARGERLVGADADAAEEAHEERLPHGDPVERERDEHHEEEQRPEHVVDTRVEVDPDRLGGRPDGQDPHRLHHEGESQHLRQQAGVVAVVVDALVEMPHRLLEPQAAEQRLRTAQQRTCGAREDEEREEEGPDHEDALEPQVRAHVVLADREQEPDRTEHEGRRAAEAPLQQHGPGDDGRAPGMTP
jgi:hypothetical protein